MAELRIDLSEFSYQELEDLSKDIDNEKHRRRTEERKNVKRQMKELAASVGMSPEEILGIEPGKKAKPRAKAKYQHPENPELTWSGRGKRPKWVNEFLEQDRTLEDLEIQ